MPTALEMTPEEWRRFNPSKNIIAQRAVNKYSAKRREKALKVAKKAATLLRKKFGAKKIVIFGSLTNEDAFSAWSDIDLAAWGIPPNRFYSAVAAITALSPLFNIDLVEPDNCRETIKEAIYREGIEI
jgi:predicted nucleotidyltransferase